MLTPSLEDYLEEIYRLSLDPGFIRITMSKGLMHPYHLSIRL